MLLGRAGLPAEVIDLGDDQYTGRPHPMIDPDARAARIVQAAADPTVGVVLLDVVLGHGAHPDPAGAVAAAVREARAAADRPVMFVASICGTAADPQGFDAQARTLREAGVLLAGSNAAAARLAIRLAAGPRRPPVIAGGVQVINAGLPLIVEVPAPDVTQLDWRRPRSPTSPRPARWSPSTTRRRPRPTRPPSPRCTRCARASWASARPARRSTRWPARRAPCCTPGHRSSTPGCAGRCAAPWSARLSSRAGPPPRGGRAGDRRGEIAVEPCHHHGAVGPMAAWSHRRCRSGRSPTTPGRRGAPSPP